MPKTHSSKPFIKWVAVAAVLAILSACGGGGSNPPPSNPTPTPTPTPTPSPAPTPDPGTTPEAFSFTAVSDAQRGALVVSGAVTITGIDAETTVSVENGEYSTGGAEFTSDAGTVENGDEIVVRTTASSEFATSVETVLTVGGVSGAFTVTTEARDITPEPFSFNSQVAEPDIEVTSNIIVVESINDAAPISVTGGAYSIDGGEFTDTEGTVSAGQSVAVRGTSATESGDVEVTLSIGEVEGVFTITTDASAPTVEIHYPPNLSLTTDTTVRVRGVASDDLSAITGIFVNGVEAMSEDDFATWTAEIPLTVDVTNEITVVATDAFGNTDNAAATANIVRRSDISDSFMDEDGFLTYPLGLALHPNTGDLIVSNRAPSGIFTLSLEDNQLTILSDTVAPNDDNVIVRPGNMVMDTISSLSPRLLVVDTTGSIVSVDPDSGVRTPFAIVDGVSDQHGHLAIDSVSKQLIVAMVDDPRLIGIDLETGISDVISSNTHPDNTPFFDRSLGGIALDSGNRIAYVRGHYDVTDFSPAIWQVDMDDGSRVVLSDNFTPDEDNPISGGAYSLVLDSARQRLLLADGGGGFDGDGASILAINLNQERGEIGSRELVLDDTPDPLNEAFPLEGIANLLIDESKDIAYMTSFLPERTAIWVMELSTGQRVFLVKGEDAEL